MKVLFAIVGVGAGNSTRNLAILDEIARLAPDTEIAIAAQGRAETVFRARYPVHALQRVTYTDGGDFSPWAMLRANLSFPLRFRANVKTYGRLIDDWKPDTVVADSDFYCLGPAKRRGVRLLTINNSAYVVETFRRLRPRPRGFAFSFRVIESTDYWLQRRYAGEVICPVLRPQDGLAAKFRQIDPIVRPGFRDRSWTAGEDLVVMLGGSGIGAASLDLRTYDGPVVALGPLPHAPPQTRHLGFVEDPLPLLRSARAVVVQGGFSSISEVLAMGKPSVIVPIPNHTEQFINARTVEELGLGVACLDGHLKAALRRLSASHEAIRAAFAASPLRFDGAVQAARLILGLPAEGAT